MSYESMQLHQNDEKHIDYETTVVLKYEKRKMYFSHFLYSTTFFFKIIKRANEMQ